MRIVPRPWAVHGEGAACGVGFARVDDYMMPWTKFPITMNALFPRPWDAIAYWLTLIISLAMAIEVILFTSSHCDQVYQQTGVPGACGLGIGWIIVCMAFLVIAGYSAWELYGLHKERNAGTCGGAGRPRA